MMNYKFRRFWAFTLAEVLITLAIIGIVAALTIPTLVSKYKEKVTVQKVTEVYSILGNAYSSLLYEEGTPDTWTDKSDLGVANMFAKKIKMTDICHTTSRKCHIYRDDVKYTSLTGYENDNYFEPYGAVGLVNGMTYRFRLRSNTCRGWSQYSWDATQIESSPYYHTCGEIFVDLNGNEPPNRYGIDLFSFIYTDRKIVPVGTPPTPYYSLNSSCNPEQTSSSDGSRNGDFCTAWILQKKNMDYLTKKVSW